MYSNETREDIEHLNELVLLQNQVKLLGLQDKLAKQNFHEVMKKVFELVTETIKDLTEDAKITMMESSKENNKALSNSNDKLPELMEDRGTLASHLLSLLSKITNPKNTSQFKLAKDPDSNRFNDLLINKTIPVTLYNNLLTFRDTDKKFELKGDLLKVITKKL